MEKKVRKLKDFKKKYNITVTIDENMEDFSKDPYVVAKNEKAAKLIAKYGLPESFNNKPKVKSSTRKA
jgi:hypothetical protein